MERAEDIEIPALPAPEADEEEIVAPRTSRARSSVSPIPVASENRWLVPALVAHAAFLSVFVAASYFVVLRVDRLESAASAQRAEIESLAKETSTVAATTGALKVETANLRQSLFSSISEDVIFLKTLILKPSIAPALAREIARHVHRYAQLYGRDANLVLAMISVESDFDPKVVSSAGAVGLMQVMPQWKKVLAIEGDLSEVEVSVKFGLQVLGFYLEMYKDLEMALTAYNRGPGPVDMALMRGTDPTNKYAPRVLAAYERLKSLSVGVAADP